MRKSHKEAKMNIKKKAKLKQSDFNPSRFQIKAIKIVSILWVVVIAFIISLNSSVIAQDVTTVPVDKVNPPPTPWSARYTRAGDAAYGISVGTWNATEDAPKFQIVGTKGSSQEIDLDNAKENFEEGLDYFFFSGITLGNIGVPIAITFTQGGSDGWGLLNPEIDHFVSPEGAPGWADAFVSTYKDLNDRASIQNFARGNGATFQTIKFSGRLGIDSDEGSAGGIKFLETHTLDAEGSALSLLPGGNNNVTLAKEIVVIDTRNFSSPFKWTSSQIAKATFASIKEAVDASERQSGWSNTVTVSAGLKKAVPGGVYEGEFKFENSTTVDGRNTTSDSNSETEKVTNSRQVSQVQEYTIPTASVAFITISRTVSVTRYTDFGGMRRIGPSVSEIINLKPTIYQVDCTDGELKLLLSSFLSANGEVAYRYGQRLKDQTDSAQYKAAIAGFGSGWSTSSIPTCPQIVTPVAPTPTTPTVAPTTTTPTVAPTTTPADPFADNSSAGEVLIQSWRVYDTSAHVNATNSSQNLAADFYVHCHDRSVKHGISMLVSIDGSVNEVSSNAKNFDYRFDRKASGNLNGQYDNQSIRINDDDIPFLVNELTTASSFAFRTNLDGQQLTYEFDVAGFNEALSASGCTFRDYIDPFADDTATSSPTNQATSQPTTPVDSTTGLSLNYNLEPYFDSLSLEAGFNPSPVTNPTSAGGVVDVASLNLGSECSGYAEEAPDYHVEWSGTSSLLRIFFTANDVNADAILIINAPDGTWVCNDDYNGAINPLIEFNNPSIGGYDIWLGNLVAASEYIEGTLYITEDPNLNP